MYVIRNYINDSYSNCCDIHNVRYTAYIDGYLQTPTSNENNLISLFITQTTQGGDKNTVFVVVELRPIFYSSKIVYSQID